MTANTGPTTGNAFRRRIEPWEFATFFDPTQLRKETCLLYETRWHRSQRVWQHSVKNTSNHAEVNFIEKFTAEKHFHSTVSCTITWFLSWSPCWECSKAIREFLSQHPNVTLVIYVARLYFHLEEQNRQGLRDLKNSGVLLQIMRLPEYDHCWRNFVNYPPEEEGRCPRFSPEFMKLYSLELCYIFRGLPSFFKISRRYQERLNLFNLTPQRCHYEMIPQDVLLAVGYNFLLLLYSNFL